MYVVDFYFLLLLKNCTWCHCARLTGSHGKPPTHTLTHSLSHTRTRTQRAQANKFSSKVQTQPGWRWLPALTALPAPASAPTPSRAELRISLFINVVPCERVSACLCRHLAYAFGFCRRRRCAFTAADRRDWLCPKTQATPHPVRQQQQRTFCRLRSRRS